MNRLDNDLQKAIFENTHHAEKHKEATWNEISKKMEEQKMSSRNKTGIWRIIAACLVLIIVIGGLFTPTGKAAISRIIDLFEPAKNIVTEIEGEQELAEQQLQIGTTSTPEPDITQPTKKITYVMYIDESKYFFESLNDTDIMKPIDFPTTLPEVVMEITQIADTSKEQAALSIVEELKQQYQTVYEPYEVTEPLEALCIDAHDGDLNGTKETMPQWDSRVIKYYLLDNTQGGIFVIKMKYFIEAEEGHGARFIAMLKEFKIVSAD